MEFSVDLLNALARRSWKIIVWILPINILASLYFSILIVIQRELYNVNMIANEDKKVNTELLYIKFGFIWEEAELLNIKKILSTI